MRTAEGLNGKLKLQAEFQRNFCNEILFSRTLCEIYADPVIWISNRRRHRRRELFPRRNRNFHLKSLLNTFLKMFDNCLRLLPRHSKDNFPNNTGTCFCYREWRETKGLMAQILNSSGSQQTPHENCCFLTICSEATLSILEDIEIPLLSRLLSHKGNFSSPSMLPQWNRNSIQILPQKDLSRCDSINSPLYSYSIPGVCPFCGHKTDPKKMIRGRDDGLCLRRIFIAVGRYIRWFYSYSSGGAFGTLTRPWLIARRHKYLKLLAIRHCHGKLHTAAPSSNYRRRVSSMR